MVLAAHVTEPLATVAPQLANKHGGKVRQTWGAALSGFSVQMTELVSTYPLTHEHNTRKYAGGADARTID